MSADQTTHDNADEAAGEGPETFLDPPQTGSPAPELTPRQGGLRSLGSRGRALARHPGFSGLAGVGRRDKHTTPTGTDGGTTVPGDEATQSGVDFKQGEAAKAKRAPQQGKAPRAPGWVDGSKPAANLVPTYVRHRRAEQATLRKGYFAVLATALLVVLVTGVAFVLRATSEGTRQEAVAERAVAAKQVTALQPIATYYDGLVARQQAMVSMMGRDLDYSRLNEAIFTASGGTGVTVETISESGAPVCSGPSPFSPAPAMGCVTITARAPSPVAAATFISNLNRKAPLIGSAFSTGFAGDQQTVSAPSGDRSGSEITVTVNYTSQALTMRYVPKEQQAQVRAQADATGQATGTNSPSVTSPSGAGTSTTSGAPATGTGATP